MKKALMLPVLIFVITCAAGLAGQSYSRIGKVSPDGRFTLYGDFTNIYRKGDHSIVTRDGVRIGAAIVTSIYPSHMTLKTLTLESGMWLKEGDQIEGIFAAAAEEAVEKTVPEPEKPAVEKTVPEPEKPRGPAVNDVSPDGAILSHGNLIEKGFRVGLVVEIVRGASIIGAAEVVELDTYNTKLKIVGALGAEVREGDTLRIPGEIVERINEKAPGSIPAPLRAAGGGNEWKLERPGKGESRKQKGKVEEKLQASAEETEEGKTKKEPIEKRLGEMKK